MEKEIAERIKLFRESKNYSQEYVALKLGITQQAYSKLEKNPLNFTLERLQKLSKILDITILSILGQDGNYLQHNFHQTGGNAATQMTVNQMNNETIQLYERYVSQLKTEIQFLRKSLEETLKDKD
jgi:transcriptional regulator with XRE-family HTH domain